MSLIVEDGSIVANANSYVSLQEARDYANARGVTLPAVDSDLEVLLIKAKDYTESKRTQYQGSKVSAIQSLQFPRYGVVVDGFEVEPTSIPIDLKNAQMQLAIELNAGTDIMPTFSGASVTEETVGPITTKYSDKGASPTSVEMTAVDALLQPLYKKGSSGAFLTTYRA